MSFEYSLIKDWALAEDGGKRGCPYLKDLDTEKKLLLVSDGSLTLHMELIYASRVEIDLFCNEIRPLEKGVAEYLEVEGGIDTIERKLWLHIGGERYLYAHALIPEEYLEDELRSQLKYFGDEPLGRLLQRRGVPLIKDSIELAPVRCPDVALGLGLDGEIPLMARRYRLLNRGPGGEPVIKASITEIFAPTFIPYRGGTD